MYISPGQNNLLGFLKSSLAIASPQHEYKMSVLNSSLDMAIVPALFALVCVYAVKRIVLYYKLRHFRGPWWSAITHLPHSRAMVTPNCHEWYAEINEKHGTRNVFLAFGSLPGFSSPQETDSITGPIARIGPGLLLTSSPEVWTHVNRHPEYKRTDWVYHAWRVEHRRDNVFTQTDNEKHEQRRKQMAPGVSSSRVDASTITPRPMSPTSLT